MDPGGGGRGGGRTLAFGIRADKAEGVSTKRAQVKAEHREDTVLLNRTKDN